MQEFMSSYRGKVYMNYAYSWGAAVVIAGTLFKLTHLPGANLMLWLGMGTEVLVFIISGFDLPKKEPKAIPAATGGVLVVGGGGNAPADDAAAAASATGEEPAEGQAFAGEPIVFGNGGGIQVAATGGPAAPGMATTAAGPQQQQPAGPQFVPVDLQPEGVVMTSPTPPPPAAQQPAPEVPALSPVFTTEMEETTQAYVAQLKEMTEMLSRFTSQADVLSKDADQMAPATAQPDKHQRHLRGTAAQCQRPDGHHRPGARGDTQAGAADRGAERHLHAYARCRTHQVARARSSSGPARSRKPARTAMPRNATTL